MPKASTRGQAKAVRWRDGEWGAVERAAKRAGLPAVELVRSLVLVGIGYEPAPKAAARARAQAEELGAR